MKERVPLVVVRTPRPGHSVSNTRRSLRGGSTRKDETKRSVSLGICGPHADLADPYLSGGTWRRLAATTSKLAAIVERYDALSVIMALCGAQVPLTTNLGVRSLKLLRRAYVFNRLG